MSDWPQMILRYRKWIFGTALVALAMGAVWHHDRDQRAAGALEERIATQAASIARLKRAAVTVQTQLVHDTVRVRETRDRWRTVVDSITRVDTVPLTRRETVLVTAAEQHVQACERITRDCGQLVTMKDSIIAGQDREIASLAKVRPSRLVGVRIVAALLLGAYVGLRLR